jgi:hypothetical protein
MNSGATARLIGPSLRFTRGTDTQPERARTLRRLLPADTVVGRRTAAWFWGLDVFPPGETQADWPLEVLLPPGRTPPSCPWTTAHITPLSPTDVVETFGVPVTTPERTALDCARRLARLAAVAAVDQFLRLGVSAEALAARGTALARQPGAGRAREVIALADAGAASPGESWTRVRIVDAGLPRPTTQLATPGPADHPLAIDLGDPDRKVGVEYDGEEFHTGPAATAHDATRRSWLRRQGWHLTVVTKYDVLLDPRAFLSDHLNALRARGWHPDDDHLCTIYANIARLDPHRRRPSM